MYVPRTSTILLFRIFFFFFKKKKRGAGTSEKHSGSFPEGLFLEAAYTRAHEMSRPCLLLHGVIYGVSSSIRSALFITLKQLAANRHGCY